MPRRRDPDAPRVVHRTARVGLRLTRAQARRCFGLLRSAADVWACAMEANQWRRRHDGPLLVSYKDLCRELSAAGPGTFGELGAAGARSVLRRYADAWFTAAKRRKAGDLSARFPRRRRGLLPIGWYHGTFGIDDARVRVPTAVGSSRLWLRLARPLPYPAEQVRSITLLCEAGRLWLDVTAEVPIAAYPPGQEPDPDRVAGIDVGIIHPYAVAAEDGQALLVSGRAVRAEHRLHLRDRKQRQRAVARRAPVPGQNGSRRWRKFRRRQRRVEAVHRRRVRQAQHEAAKSVIGWAVQQRIGTLTIGDPRGVLDLDAGRRHNLRLRQWQLGRLLQLLRDKAEQAGIRIHLVDERGTSSTCPHCAQRVPKPKGRTMVCPRCGIIGHRDLVAAATIATRTPGGGPTTPCMPRVVTHRRAGRHLPGVRTARRDPRRRPQQRRQGPLARRGPPRPHNGQGVARLTSEEYQTATRDKRV